jgi:glycoprotein 6-alpha-L-fucosyltransferase
LAIGLYICEDNVEDVQVVELPIVDNLRPRPPYMPQAIPSDLAPRLLRLHGHPFVWWVGQFVSYLFRPQPWLASDIKKMQEKLGFKNPIVGLVPEVCVDSC